MPNPFPLLSPPKPVQTRPAATVAARWPVVLGSFPALEVSLFAAFALFLGLS
ncbi:hypothetical protein [Tabrizicola sp.]|uniref:hypothetical protein n=1 Tax=Tabrizicola sp. TaxID=2005166 RepID=UPI003F31CE88